MNFRDTMMEAIVLLVSAAVLVLLFLVAARTDLVTNCVTEPVQQEMTMEEKIEKYKQFDQTHPADSLFFEQRYSVPTITGTLL